MFGSKKNTNSKNTSGNSSRGREGANSRNQIGKFTKIVGEVDCVGNMRIDGILEGQLRSEAKVVVGETGSLIGEMVCEHADIQGRVEGNLTVRGTLYLYSTAVIQGNIVTNKLVVDADAVINGNISMDSEEARRKLANTDSKPISSGKPAGQR